MPNWRTGAPAGNRNAVKHGRYTAERRAAAREVMLVLRRARMHIAMAEAFLAQERALKRIFSKTTPAEFRRKRSTARAKRIFSKTTSAEFRQKSAMLQQEDLPPSPASLSASPRQVCLTWHAEAICGGGRKGRGVSSAQSNLDSRRHGTMIRPSQGRPAKRMREARLRSRWSRVPLNLIRFVPA
jgi:hypothetical protein